MQQEVERKRAIADEVKTRQRAFDAEYRQQLADDFARRQRLHDAIAREKYVGSDPPNTSPAATRRVCPLVSSPSSLVDANATSSVDVLEVYPPMDGLHMRRPTLAQSAYDSSSDGEEGEPSAAQ